MAIIVVASISAYVSKVAFWSQEWLSGIKKGHDKVGIKELSVLIEMFYILVELCSDGYTYTLVILSEL